MKTESDDIFLKSRSTAIISVGALNDLMNIFYYYPNDEKYILYTGPRPQK